MCDYSLHSVLTRPAKIADKLVTRNFGYSSGFCDTNNRNVAVCLLPGTEVVFAKNATTGRSALTTFLRSLFGMDNRRRQILGKTAIFCKFNEQEPAKHHDALEFENGRVVLLNKLSPGQRATVLQLPAQAKPEFKPENALPEETQVWPEDTQRLPESILN